MEMPQISELKSLIEPILAAMDIDLVDLEVHGHKDSSVVRIYIDEAGGISLARCSSASRAIAGCLEQNDPFPGHYTLEVSSPGVDRPLTTEKDFSRHRGRKIALTYSQDKREVGTKGTIEKMEGGKLYLQTAEDMLIIQVSDVILAKIVIEFK